MQNDVQLYSSYVYLAKEVKNESFTIVLIIIIICRFLVRLLQYEYKCITAVHKTLKTKS